MKTLHEWAEHYKKLRIWIYPYKNYSEQFEWLHWRNMKESDYNEEFKSFKWNCVEGINIVTGKKGVLVLSFVKDESNGYATNSLLKVLSLLGLPKDYDWVIESKTYYSIIVDVHSMPMGRIQKKYRNFVLRYEESYILPPGIENYESWFKNGIPQTHPIQISWFLFKEKIAEIEKLSLVDRGLSKEEGGRIIKMKITIGCLLVIAISIITGIIAFCNSVSFEVWLAMFVVTLVAVVGLIYIMSH